MTSELQYHHYPLWITFSARRCCKPHCVTQWHLRNSVWKNKKLMACEAQVVGIQMERRNTFIFIHHVI